MAKFLSKYMADNVANWYKGTAFPLAPATLYIALFTVAPTARDGTGGTEVSTTGTAYARQGIANTGWGAVATSGSGTTSLEQITQTATINFPTATAAWGTIVGIGLYDAVTAGNFISYGDLTASVAINNGDTFQIPATDLQNQV